MYWPDKYYPGSCKESMGNNRIHCSAVGETVPLIQKAVQMTNKYVSMRKTTYKDYLDNPPNVIVLPWGATEAHNYHLPYASDTMQAEMISEIAAALAVDKGAKITVLPCIPNIHVRA